MSKFRLTYFDSRGRAEVSRLLCAAAGKDFEDIRIPVEDGNKNKAWLSIKERAPFGQIPMLEVDDEFTLAQSHSIERFLAREFDMAGTESFERAEIDMFIGAVEDVLTLLIEYQFMEKDESKKKVLKKKILDSSGPILFSEIEAQIGATNTGYIVGDSLTVADICLYDLRCWFQTVFPEESLLFLGPYENCTKNSQLVTQNPGINAWLKRRPQTAF